MRSYRTRIRLGFLLAIAVAAALVTSVVAWPTGSGTASALGDEATLSGEWAPFTRCPVDHPQMLAVDGQTTYSYCVAAHSGGGSIKLGNSNATTGPSDMQFGITGASTWDVISPDGGAIIAAPADVPGGLLGLMCPSLDPAVTAVCSLITDNSLNKVTAVVETAGPLTDFNFSAGLALGVPIVTLPIKVHLENSLLGDTCYIGSDANPIVLHPQNTDISHSTFSVVRFAPDGADSPDGELQVIKSIGATQGDNQFAVPGTSGCGVGGLLDTAIDLKEGFPSAAGNNSIVLNDSASYLASFTFPSDFSPNAGQHFSDDWHAGVCACGTGGTATPTPTSTSILPTITAVPTLAPLSCTGDSDCDGCPDADEGKLRPPTNPANPWDFYDVPAPALRLGYTGQARDHAIGVTSDVLALLSYAGENSLSPDYTADRDANGTEDGLQYDRAVTVADGQQAPSGPPDGAIGVTSDVLGMMAQVGDACS